ncbi:META domain-containing protein [Comamonas sp.]|uniref:META domain-containing protein n=1 Tax=Comamonas sp. TaxID=34028 RepID=UPI0028A2AF89|nr:META domain-containing protein [Comamonas sp.]
MRRSHLLLISCLYILGLSPAQGREVHPDPSAVTPSQTAVLAGYFWDMDAAFDKSGVPQPFWFSKDSPPVRLTFSRDGHAFAENACNNLNWKFKVSGTEKIAFTPTASTLIGCNEELTQRQNLVGMGIPQTHRYTLKATFTNVPERLTLYLADGSRWEFKPIPTPETRYGGPGKQIELEIAMDTVPCGPGSTQQCLNARQVRWERNTSKVCLSDWEVLKSGIEGYQPTPGRHEIIWVKAYPLNRVSSKTSGSAYVFLGVHVSVIPSLKKLPDCSPSATK